MQLTAKRVNVIIGEANTGKSNLLEAMALLSADEQYQGSERIESITEQFRIERPSQLFWDELYSDLEIQLNNCLLKLSFTPPAEVRGGIWLEDGESRIINHRFADHEDAHALYRDFRGSGTEELLGKIHFFKNSDQAGLNGLIKSLQRHINLPFFAQQFKDFNHEIKNIFEEWGYKVGLNVTEEKLILMKDIDDDTRFFPFSMVSDTLKSYLYHKAAIYGYQGKILLFEEPDARTYPFYAGDLAETMAKDELGTQFFVVTHNPWFLGMILQKTNRADLAINIAFMEEGATQFKQLNEEEMGELDSLGSSGILNLDHFLEA